MKVLICTDLVVFGFIITRDAINYLIDSLYDLIGVC